MISYRKFESSTTSSLYLSMNNHETLIRGQPCSSSRSLWQPRQNCKLFLLYLLVLAHANNCGRITAFSPFPPAAFVRQNRSPLSILSSTFQVVQETEAGHDQSADLDEHDGASQGEERYEEKNKSVEEKLQQVSSTEEKDEDKGAKQIKHPATSLWDMVALKDEQTPLVGVVKSIGVDYGLVRTGVAVTIGYDPKPIAILSDLNNTQLCQKVLEFAKAEQVAKIIVGLPLHKNGTVAEQTNLTLVFAEEMARASLLELGPRVPVEMWDERYTSKEAAARAHAKDPNRFLYGSLDADAACIILEHYYHDSGKGRVLVSIPDHIQAEFIQEYEKKKAKEDEGRLSALLERGRRMQRRKETMARAQIIEKEHTEVHGSRKKKKKKKRK